MVLQGKSRLLVSSLCLPHAMQAVLHMTQAVPHTMQAVPLPGEAPRLCNQSPTVIYSIYIHCIRCILIETT